MGIDTCIRLPANVRVRDVARVCGVLLGLPVQKHSLGGSSWCADVPGANSKTANMETCCYIVIDAGTGKLVTGESREDLFYHFEGDGGSRLIGGRSFAVLIALGRRLVEFFGGGVDYVDHDEEGDDFVRPEQADDMNCPEDGAAWHHLQQRILDLPPLTANEIAECEQYASYTRKDF